MINWMHLFLWRVKNVCPFLSGLFYTYYLFGNISLRLWDSMTISTPVGEGLYNLGLCPLLTAKGWTIYYYVHSCRWGAVQSRTLSTPVGKGLCNLRLCPLMSAKVCTIKDYVHSCWRRTVQSRTMSTSVGEGLYNLGLCPLLQSLSRGQIYHLRSIFR